MNAVHNNNDTIIYHTYMNTILDFIKNSDYYNYCFHQFDKNKLYIDEFKNYISPKKEGYLSKEIVFDFIKDKKILIISPFAPLMKQQVDNNNIKMIYDNFPNVINIVVYRNIYTFFNKGPHNNILETVEYIFNDIKNINEEYDSVLISCGAYSVLLANKLYNISKNVCVIGGDLTTLFGIKCIRNKKTNYNEYWINIPDEYKPDDFMKIEDGCYW